MSFSMTGYGQSARHFEGYKLEFEVKSVNHAIAKLFFACRENGHALKTR